MNLRLAAETRCSPGVMKGIFVSHGCAISAGFFPTYDSNALQSTNFQVVGEYFTLMDEQLEQHFPKS